MGTTYDENKMPILSASEASRGFSEMLERVYFQQQSYRIMKHGIVMAIIQPAAPFVSTAMKTKGARLDRIPTLKKKKPIPR